jgi:AraC-like DNA-binding protein
MLSVSEIAQRPDFTVSSVICRNDHRRWSEPEVHDDYRVVFVRRGRFRRRGAATEADIDPAMAYIGRPGEEERFAHPSGGDVCTSVGVAPELWRDVAGDDPGVIRSTVYVDARLDLAHRRLLASSDDVGYALTEELLRLLGDVAARTVAGPSPVGAPAGDRRIVAAAREAVGDAHPASGTLVSLAALLNVSPYRLSRAFTREMGVSLTRYRNRVRVGRALDRLEDGEDRLGALAADLGFADQAHLCRTVREHLGHTPTTVRRLLN